MVNFGRESGRLVREVVRVGMRVRMGVLWAWGEEGGREGERSSGFPWLGRPFLHPLEHLRPDPLTASLALKYNGLVDTGWAGYPPTGYPPSYLGSSLPACPSGHAHTAHHAHMPPALPSATQREAIETAAATASHHSLLSETLGGDASLALAKDLLPAAPPCSRRPCPSPRPSVCSGAASACWGGGASTIGGGASMLGAVSACLGRSRRGGSGMYLNPPVLPASLLYTSLCSALPHTPTSQAPPLSTPPREDLLRPSSSATGLPQALPSLGGLSSLPGHPPRPPTPCGAPTDPGSATGAEVVRGRAHDPAAGGL
ncbi:hypothetical protein C7M84_000558 [Penaeus vannamei]|uniref:Uncharacterized protein n=1 Tax=Penaeus vannamei TaxID=6689 RepID=A0A3R7QJC5_PENVA|nr:hypothetical protein C7M84_000558 [Penaeus vannamei]